MLIVENSNMIQEILYPGKGVQVEVINNYGNKIIRKTTVCKLEHSHLALHLPYKGEIFSHVRPNSEITVVCKHNQAPEDHVFFTRFITVTGNNPPVAILNPPEDFKKGRQYARFEVAVPFSYFARNKEVKGGMVNDLSITGLLATIQPNERLKEKDKLTFKLFIPSKTGPLLMVGDIVRLVKFDTAYQVALHFPHIGLDVQDKIIKFLFMSQRVIIHNTRDQQPAERFSENPPMFNKKAGRF